jgi:hypothetical protein
MCSEPLRTCIKNAENLNTHFYFSVVIMRELAVSNGEIPGRHSTEEYLLQCFLEQVILMANKCR